MDNPNSQVELERLYGVFSRINKSCSGYISKAEMETFINTLHTPLTESEKQDVVKLIPKEGLDFNKFRDIWESYINMPVEINRIEDVFAYSDKNNDGKISYQELKNIFNHLSQPKTEKELRKLIAVADLDGDGFISLEEFKEILKK